MPAGIGRRFCSSSSTSFPALIRRSSIRRSFSGARTSGGNRTEGLRCLLDKQGLYAAPAHAVLSLGLVWSAAVAALVSASEVPSGDWRWDAIYRCSRLRWRFGSASEAAASWPCRSSAERDPRCPASARSVIPSGQTLAEQHWRFGNGCLALEVDERGLCVCRMPGAWISSAPVQIKRYQDHGEFWDAWDLAGYPQHPLPAAAMEGGDAGMGPWHGWFCVAPSAKARCRWI